MNSRKKKILFFIATLAQGGGERFISELSFKLQDFEVVIVISENKVSYPYAGRLIVLDVPFPENFFLKIYCYFLRFLKLRNVVIKEKPDYVVSFGAFANVLNVFLRSKVILHTDSFYSRRKDFWGFLLKHFSRFFYNRAERIVPMSLVAAHDLRENYGVQKEKVQVIYNPLNIKKIQTLAGEPIDGGFQELFSHPVVITMGRFSKEKGQWHLVKAFKKFKETVRNAKLVILGEGELEPVLSRLAKDLSINEDVHFLGWQENPFRFLARAEMFVLSSFREGLPASLLEAMACGVPVISSDCKSGPREILGPATDIHKETKEIEIADYGMLVPPFDEKLPFKNVLTKEEETLSKAILLLHEDSLLKERLSKGARDRAEDFDIERILQDWKLMLHCGTLGDTKI